MNHSIMRRLAKRKRMGQAAVVLLILLLVPLFTIGASAHSPSFPAGAVETPVTLNGRAVLEGECMRINGVTYVPLRSFCNLFDDCRITWNGATNTATVETDSLTLIAHTGNYYIYANGHYFYTVEAVLNLGGRLYVPVRPLARAFNASLEWNAAAARVELKKSGTGAVAWARYNADSLYWLSRIISAEAGGEPFLGQIAVGNVVLNRVESREYPNSIYGVIFDRRHGTQFTPAVSGTIYRAPTAEAVIAAKICLEGYTLSDEVLFFFNPRIATSNWISKNRPFAFRIGNHDFYY